MTVADDPILTTREAAELLGVSIRTAQIWIEQGLMQSWKTPGGHRRVRRSAVEALRRRKPVEATSASSLPTSFALVLADEANLRRYIDVLASTGLQVTGESDMLNALLQSGVTLPAVIVVELVGENWNRLAMLRRILQTPSLAHTRIVTISSLSSSQLRMDLGALDRVTIVPPDAADADLVAAVRANLPARRVSHQVRLASDSTETRDARAVPKGAEPLPFPVAPNENERLDALYRTGLIDTAEEPAYDDVVRLTASTLRAPICLISLLTPDRQWFKAHWGLEARETPRAWAFCNHTILQRDAFVVDDAAMDARFRANPLVTGDPRIRFYAGAVLRDFDGYPLGALCVIDRVPRSLQPEDHDHLLTLAALASDRINLQTRQRLLRHDAA